MTNERTPEEIKARKEEMIKLHNEKVKRLVESFINGANDIWPELKNFDFSAYKIDPKEFAERGYERFRFLLGIEQLYCYASMLNASREELVRILKFLYILAIAQNEFLDIKKAKYDLGISSLKKKYIGMFYDKQNN